MARFLLILVLIAAAVGAGIALWPGKAANATPEAAVRSIYGAVERHDVPTLVALLPPDARTQARADWDQWRASVDATMQVQLNMVLSQLSAPNAEETLFELIKPNLRAAQAQLRQAGAFLPMVLGGAMAQAPGGDAMRADMAKLTQGVQTWINGIDLADEAKLKQALGAVCGAVRATGIKNTADLTALSFDAMQAKADHALGGIFSLFQTYGLDLAAICRSIEVGTPTVTGDAATVPVTVSVFGQRLSGNLGLTRIDGGWYPQGAQRSGR